MTLPKAALSVEADAAAGGGIKNPTTPKLSRRERRKLLNAQHAAPEMVKVQSVERRQQLHVARSGLRTKTPLKGVNLHDPMLQFGKLLGASDARLRHQAMVALRTWLRARVTAHGVSETDLMKLWKAVTMTLYLADQVAVQEQVSAHIVALMECLAGSEEEDVYAGRVYLEMCGDDDDDEYDSDEHGSAGSSHDDDEDHDFVMQEVSNTLHDDDDGDNMDENDNNQRDDDNNDDVEDAADESPLAGNDNASIPHCRGAHLCSIFVRTFFRTLLRDWGNYDKYRVDKFYTLIRYMMRTVLCYMATRHWNLGLIRLFNDAMYEEALQKTPNGVRLHMIDVVLDELVNAATTSMEQSVLHLTEATYLDVMEPYFAMLQTGGGDGHDAVQARVVEQVGVKFLERYSVVRMDNDNSTDGIPVLDQVHVGTIAQFLFDIASDENTLDRYRSALYDLHKRYMRRIKLVGTDVNIEPDGGDDNSVTEEEDDRDDDMVEVAKAPPAKNDVNKKADTPKKKKKHNVQSKSPAPQEDAEMVNSIEGSVSSTKAPDHTSEPVASQQSHETKKNKKKKRKREGRGDIPSTPVASNHAFAALPEASNANARRGTSVMDEEVTITVREQKKAKQSNRTETFKSMTIETFPKPKPPKSKQQLAEELRSAEELKTVKWNVQNQSRSWKASMKALRTNEIATRLASSPGGSILRPPKVAAKSKRSRVK